MASENQQSKVFDRELLSPEERAPFEAAGKVALDLVKDRLKEAWEKRVASQAEPSSSPAGAEVSQGANASDASSAGEVAKEEDRSKAVADLLSRQATVDSPMMRADMLTKEWESFLARPDGQETADMLKDILTKEWKAFDQEISQEADTRGAFISKQEKLRLWKALLLPQLKESILEYLEAKKSIPRRNGGLIFRAMIRELEGATENKK